MPIDNWAAYGVAPAAPHWYSLDATDGLVLLAAVLGVVLSVVLNRYCAQRPPKVTR